MKINNLVVAETDSGVQSIFAITEKTNCYNYKLHKKRHRQIIPCVERITTYSDLFFGFRAVYGVLENENVDSKGIWLDELYGANCKLDSETIFPYKILRNYIIKEKKLPLSLDAENVNFDELLTILFFSKEGYSFDKQKKYLYNS